jgi:hypothetical protein
VKAYFALFILPNPQREHAQIVDVIRAASSGDFKQFVFAGGISFVYMAATPPWLLSFSKILHTGDSKLITELSSDGISHEGFGTAAGWLNSHFPRR